MRPFNSEALCAKCGADGAYAKWRPHVPSTWLIKPGFQQLTTEEHIERECARCGFKWAEAVIAS